MRRAPILIVLAAAVLLVLFRLLVVSGGGQYERPATWDMNSVRNIVGLLIRADELPMKDGKLDVYALVRRGDIGESDVDVFASVRFKYGPTKEQVLAGDYTAFPYGRYVGSAKPKGDPPLLWDRLPDDEGLRVVGLYSGAVRRMDEAEFRTLLERYAQSPQLPR